MSALGRVPRTRRLSTVEQVWRDMWVDSAKPSLGNPCKAFITLCRKRYGHNPNPRTQSLSPILEVGPGYRVPRREKCQARFHHQPLPGKIVSLIKKTFVLLGFPA